jgi:hypothetical protein
VARTRYGFISVIARRNYVDGGVSDYREVEVSVAELLTIDVRNLHFVGGLSAEAVGKW